MTIWRHWCKGCGERVEASVGGYCQAEECRGLRRARIDRDLQGSGTRMELLQALDVEIAKGRTPGPLDTLKMLVEMRTAVLGYRWDKIPRSRWEQFECIKRGVSHDATPTSKVVPHREAAVTFAGSGNHLDKVAVINGVFRNLGESDEGLRSRLAKILGYWSC